METWPCKMNMVLHGIVDAKIMYGDVLSNPQLVEGGKLKTYDRVLANFPFSMDWDNTYAAKDPYGRFKYGIPPAKDKADFAFIQHMLASLNDKGRAAIICSQGILFRGGEEEEIRKNMVLGNPEKGLQGDVIEGIVAPSALDSSNPYLSSIGPKTLYVLLFFLSIGVPVNANTAFGIAVRMASALNLYCVL